MMTTDWCSRLPQGAEVFSKPAAQLLEAEVKVFGVGGPYWLQTMMMKAGSRICRLSQGAEVLFKVVAQILEVEVP